VAVLRFNTRGTVSEQGKSEGEFGAGETERYDVAAAVEYAVAAGLPEILAARLVVRHGAGAPLGPAARSPGRHPAVTAACAGPSDADLDAWAAAGRPLTVLVPEFDDYLRPDEARSRFARVPKADVIGVPGAKHLWVGGELRPHRAQRDRPDGQTRPRSPTAPCRRLGANEPA